MTSRLKYDGIKQAVALLQGDKRYQYLIAYYVAEKAHDNELILSELRKNLPQFMLPRTLMHLDCLPLTINGKLDRNRLPLPEITTSVHTYDPPITGTEFEIAEIWCEVLQLSHCESISTSFFVMGGTSLLSILFLGKVNKKFSKNLTLKDLFDSFTVRAIATKIVQGDEFSPTLLVSMGQQQAHKPNLYIFPGLASFSASYYPLGSFLSSQFSVKCFEYKGIHGECVPHMDAHEMLNDYFIAIKNDKPTQKVFLMGHSLGCSHVAEMSYKLTQAGFNIEVILLDGEVNLKTHQRESLDDEAIEQRHQILKNIFESRLKEVYLNHTLTGTVGSTLEQIAYGLFPDPSVAYDYKMRIAKGFSDVGTAQINLNSDQLLFESYGKVQHEVRTLLVCAEEQDESIRERFVDNVSQVFPQLTVITSPGSHVGMVMNKEHAVTLGNRIISTLADSCDDAFNVVDAEKGKNQLVSEEA